MKTLNEKENQIIQKYQQNVSIDEICNEYEVNEQQIRQVLKQNNIDRKKTSFSDELQERIIELYTQGHTQKYIEETLLISRSGIINTLKRNNIPRRSSSENNQKYDRNSHYFDNIVTENQAYILGMLFADGNNNTAHNSITLSLQERDKHLLEQIAYEIGYSGPLRLNPLHEINPNYQNHYILNINDEHMSQTLNELGMVNAKSLKLQFPIFLPQNLRRHFMRGYFDGDGNIYYDQKRKKCQTQTVGTFHFCAHLSQELLGLDCKNCIKHPKQCSDNTFVVQTGGNKSSYTFLSWMYEDSNLKLERKYAQFESFSSQYH